MNLGELNALDNSSAQELFRRCCGADRWVAIMDGQRPFESVSELHKKAEDAWNSLAVDDRLQAFSSHPKIGERKNVGSWSREEQKGMEGSSHQLAEKMAAMNREYEQRFGFVFIICATGRSAQEMLRSLEERSKNDEAAELRIASQEQMKIMHLRLDKLLSV